MPTFNYGGQALIEGVLMRGRDAIAVAFRHPEGHIVWASESLDKGPHAWRFAKTPFARGLIVLYETLIVGTRWLVRSANIQANAEGIELGRGSVALILGLIARTPDIRRVFEYHGAEHMTIHALEAGDPLTTDAVHKYPTAHPRCGTEFLVVVILLSVLLFGFLGRD